MAKASGTSNCRTSVSAQEVWKRLADCLQGGSRPTWAAQMARLTAAGRTLANEAALTCEFTNPDWKPVPGLLKTWSDANKCCTIIINPDAPLKRIYELIVEPSGTETLIKATVTVETDDTRYCNGMPNFFIPQYERDLKEGLAADFGRG